MPFSHSYVICFRSLGPNHSSESKPQPGSSSGGLDLSHVCIEPREEEDAGGGRSTLYWLSRSEKGKTTWPLAYMRAAAHRGR